MRNAETSSPGGRGRGSPTISQVDDQTGLPDGLDQVAEAGQAGRRLPLGLVVVGPEDADQPAEFGQRRPPGGLDLDECVPGRGPFLPEREPLGAGLQHHQAQGVADDVVQLAGDPRPLAGHRQAGVLRALPLQLVREHGEFRGLPSPAAHEAARQPRGDGQRAHHDEVLRLVDEDAAERHHEAPARRARSSACAATE